MSRTWLALLALLGLTAFAPAPFLRPERRGDDRITLEGFQGTWRVVNMQTSRSSGKHDPYSWTVTHIRVTKDRWEFMVGPQSSNTFHIGIDPAKRPAHLNFYHQQGGPPTGVGLIRRHGNRVLILYAWGGEKSRPASFEPPPDGPWLMTLERDR